VEILTKIPCKLNASCFENLDFDLEEEGGWDDQPGEVGISALAIRKGCYLRHGGYESETTVTYYS
jgi:hypothetical protein